MGTVEGGRQRCLGEVATATLLYQAMIVLGAQMTQQCQVCSWRWLWQWHLKPALALSSPCMAAGAVLWCAPPCAWCNTVYYTVGLGSVPVTRTLCP